MIRHPGCLVGVVLLACLAGCGKKTESVPGSGPGNPDPDRERTAKAHLAAATLLNAVGAVAERREDGKWKVNATDSRFADSHLKLLEDIQPLGELHLTGTLVTDLGMRDVARFTTLDWLSLFGTRVGDIGFVELKTLTGLRRLAVSQHITDEALVVVGQMKELRNLVLAQTAVGPEGLKHLKELPHLETLSLSYAGVNDAALKVVADLKSIKNLDLLRATLTEEGLKELVRLPGLEILDLRVTGITDTGVKHLEAMRGLKEVNLLQTSVTRQGAEALRKSRPDLKVYH